MNYSEEIDPAVQGGLRHFPEGGGLLDRLFSPAARNGYERGYNEGFADGVAAVRKSRRRWGAWGRGTS